MTALNKWDQRMLDLAHHVKAWSKDPRTKVGAVITYEDHRVASMGYNGFPRGVEDREDRLNDRPTKAKFVSHAERNALDNADTSLRGCTMYVTLQPCSECTKSMIQKGIRKLIVCMDASRPEYLQEFREYSQVMLAEAGVEVIEIET